LLRFKRLHEYRVSQKTSNKRPDLLLQPRLHKAKAHQPLLQIFSRQLLKLVLECHTWKNVELTIPTQKVSVVQEVDLLPESLGYFFTNNQKINEPKKRLLN
jgi:hypothetical protein